MRMQDQEKKMEDKSAVMQKMSNELVTMKRKQDKNNKPPNFSTKVPYIIDPQTRVVFPTIRIDLSTTHIL